MCLITSYQVYFTHERWMVWSIWMLVHLLHVVIYIKKLLPVFKHIYSQRKDLLISSEASIRRNRLGILYNIWDAKIALSWYKKMLTWLLVMLPEEVNYKWWFFARELRIFPLMIRNSHLKLDISDELSLTLNGNWNSFSFSVL